VKHTERHVHSDPGCAHWFNSNFLLERLEISPTPFGGDGRLFTSVVSKPELERDPNLAETIIKTELPMILNWAIQGVTDYLENQTLLIQRRTIKLRLIEWKREE
jgi:putative DNA primase/helicase